MINYELRRNKTKEGKKNPILWFGTDEWWILSEWNRLPKVQVIQAIKDMDAVKSGEKDMCEFGYDMTIYIYEEGRSYLWYDYPKKEMDVPFDDIYNLMKDWLAYIEEWEKETGMKKK